MPWHVRLLGGPSCFVIWIHTKSSPHGRGELGCLVSRKTLRDLHEAMLEKVSFLFFCE